jgi:hypothetical protein
MDNLSGKLTEYKDFYIKAQQRIRYKYLNALEDNNKLEVQLLEVQTENFKMKMNFEKEINELKKKLNTFEKSYMKLENICSICYDVPCNDEYCFNAIYKTTCGHIFHRYCLETWLKNDKNNSCPMCRGPITYYALEY